VIYKEKIQILFTSPPLEDRLVMALDGFWGSCRFRFLGIQRGGD